MADLKDNTNSSMPPSGGWGQHYIQRCLQLAQNGVGYVAPNPMVGAVVVYNDKIIGEGFHNQGNSRFTRRPLFTPTQLSGYDYST